MARDCEGRMGRVRTLRVRRMASLTTAAIFLSQVSCATSRTGADSPKRIRNDLRQLGLDDLASRFDEAIAAHKGGNDARLLRIQREAFCENAEALANADGPAKQVRALERACEYLESLAELRTTSPSRPSRKAAERREPAPSCRARELPAPSRVCGTPAGAKLGNSADLWDALFHRNPEAEPLKHDRSAIAVNNVNLDERVRLGTKGRQIGQILSNPKVKLPKPLTPREFDARVDDYLKLGPSGHKRCGRATLFLLAEVEEADGTAFAACMPTQNDDLVSCPPPIAKCALCVVQLTQEMDSLGEFGTKVDVRIACEAEKGRWSGWAPVFEDSVSVSTDPDLGEFDPVEQQFEIDLRPTNLQNWVAASRSERTAFFKTPTLMTEGIGLRVLGVEKDGAAVRRFMDGGGSRPGRSGTGGTSK